MTIIYHIDKQAGITYVVWDGIVAHGAFPQALLNEQLISPYEPSVIVFHNLDTACIWLGTDSESAAQAIKSLRVRAQEEGAR